MVLSKKLGTYFREATSSYPTRPGTRTIVGRIVSITHTNIRGKQRKPRGNNDAQTNVVTKSCCRLTHGAGFVVDVGNRLGRGFAEVAAAQSYKRIWKIRPPYRR